VRDVLSLRAEMRLGCCPQVPEWTGDPPELSRVSDLPNRLLGGGRDEAKCIRRGCTCYSSLDRFNVYYAAASEDVVTGSGCQRVRVSDSMGGSACQKEVRVWIWTREAGQWWSGCM
jgi:hypothetical protein